MTPSERQIGLYVALLGLASVPLLLTVANWEPDLVARDLPVWVLAVIAALFLALPVRRFEAGLVIQVPYVEALVVIGAVTVGGRDTVVTLAVVTVADAILRRKAWLKTAYNVMAQMLAQLTALACAAAFAAAFGLQGPRYVIALVLVGLVTGPLLTMMTWVVVRLAGGTASAHRRALRLELLWAAVPSTFGGLLLASIGALLLQSDQPGAAVLPLMVHLVTIGSSRARAALEQRVAHFERAADVLPTGSVDFDDVFQSVVDTAVERTGAVVGELRLDVAVGSLPAARFPSPRAGRNQEDQSLSKSSDSIIEELRVRGVVVGVLMVTGQQIAASRFHDEAKTMLRQLAAQTSALLTDVEGGASHDAITELRKQLAEAIDRDTLTGLPNRHACVKHLAGNTADTGSVLVLDVVGFALHNERLGIQGGDELLRQIALRMTDLIRPGDLAARTGPNAFALALPAVDEAGLVGVVDRVDAAFARPFLFDGLSVHVQRRIGVATMSPGDDAAELLSSADLALQHGRATAAPGTDVLASYRPQLRHALRDRAWLLEELRAVLETGGLDVHYQPLVDLTTGEIAGFEALVRWTHPIRGVIRPDEFIPVAEASGLVIPLGTHVLRRAVRDLAHLRASTGRDLYVSVNVAASQFRGGRLLSDVDDVLHDGIVPAGRVVLELTERDLMSNVATTVEALRELTDRGIRIAIDDFGTGYSSLAYLQRYPVDIVKVAKEFVDEVTHHDGAAMVRAVVGIATALNLRTIVEGVEDARQAALLTGLGCEVGQGWLWSKAVPVEEALALLDDPVFVSA